MEFKRVHKIKDLKDNSATVKARKEKGSLHKSRKVQRHRGTI